MKSDAHVTEVRLPENVTGILENILGCELENVTEGMDFNPDSLQTLLTSLSSDSLENYLSPQWVVLAAGKGTRIDPTGCFSKTLDIMFGEQNMLQRSCRFLPGNRPHIVVINPQMANRIEESGSSEQLLGAQYDALVFKKR